MCGICRPRFRDYRTRESLHDKPFTEYSAYSGRWLNDLQLCSLSFPAWRHQVNVKAAAAALLFSFFFWTSFERVADSAEALSNPQRGGYLTAFRFFPLRFFLSSKTRIKLRYVPCLYLPERDSHTCVNNWFSSSMVFVHCAVLHVYIFLRFH